MIFPNAVMRWSECWFTNAMAGGLAVAVMGALAVAVGCCSGVALGAS